MVGYQREMSTEFDDSRRIAMLHECTADGLGCCFVDAEHLRSMNMQCHMSKQKPVPHRAWCAGQQELAGALAVGKLNEPRTMLPAELARRERTRALPPVGRAIVDTCPGQIRKRWTWLCISIEYQYDIQ